MASEVATGIFQKSVAAAPAAQTVTGIVGDDGVAFTPKVVIMWTVGSPLALDAWADHYRFGMGFSVGAGDSWSVSGAARDNVVTWDASQRYANKALVIVQWGEVIDSECDFVSFGLGEFTVNWTTNSANAWWIQYVALGGVDTEASIIRWQTNVGLGNQAVVGAGFQPETLIHLIAGDQTAYPYTRTRVRHGLGWVGKEGDAFANAIYDLDGLVRMNSRVQGGFGTDCLNLVSSGGAGLFFFRASHVSLDADGFTVNVTNNAAAQNFWVGTLCMRGFESRVGVFGKSVAAAPVAQNVAGIGLSPTLLFLSGWQNTSLVDGRTEARHGLGAATLADEHAQVIQSAYNANPSNTASYHASSKAFVKADNNTKTIDAECDLTAFGADDFTVTWTTNDAVLTQMGYLVFGDLAPAPPAPSGGAVPFERHLEDSFQSVGLTIGVFKPSITLGPPVVYAPEGNLIDVLDNQFSDLQFSIQAVGGYWAASFTVNGSLRQIEEWLELGLNRHIVVWDHQQNVCWEGFVDRVSANVAGLTITRGPLSAIANRVLVMFSELDTSVSPPTTGIRTVTTITQNVASQALYGIYDKVVNGGELDNGAGILEADGLRDTFLLENALPATTKEWGTERTDAPSVKVDCLGYVHKLGYWYESDQNLTVTASVKIGYLLDGDPGDVASVGDPNNLFSAATSSIAANPVLVSRYEEDYGLAWDLILDAVARGGAANERWLAGVYAGRRLVYAAAPAVLAYEQNIYDAHQRVTTPEGTMVRPWNVLPGKWLLFTDLLIGKTVPVATLRDDPRAMFIEAVDYKAPFGLTLQGGKVGTLSQWMAQRGLGTAGA